MADSPAQPAATRRGDPQPTSDGLLPVLPKGDPLFDNIPSRAVVLEELPPALGDGALIVRRRDDVGVILIRERVLFESYCYSDGQRLYGRAATEMMKSWDDATVSAYRLEPEVVDICPSLLRGDTLYGDLRLSWTDWNQLVADLMSRDGHFVVEVRTSKERGVTCIADGRHIATFTDAHPDVGAPTLLDGLTSSPDGSIWVHGEPAVLDVEAWAATQKAKSTSPSAPKDDGVPAAAPATGPGVSGPAVTSEPVAATPTAPASPPANGSGLGAPSPQPSALEAVFANAGDQAPPGGESMSSLDDLLPQLRAIASDRLQRSAARVEAMLDDGAEAGKSLDEVLNEISALVIRGVMQSTLDEMVGEMRALASNHAA